MTKIRKQRVKKRFQYNRNRKRVNKARTNTGKIKSADAKQHWEERKTVKRNIYEMGLAVDPNKSIEIPSTKQERIKIVKLVNGFVEEEIDAGKNLDKTKNMPKIAVAQKLEEEANAFRESQLRLPKGVIAELSYFMDKYQLNYKAMVRDRRNHNQYTWRQFRNKVRKFMGISEQFGAYLKSRNLDLGSLDWEECTSDDD